MDPTKDFSSFYDGVTSALVNITKTTAQLGAEDVSFQRSLSPSIAKTFDRHDARLLSLAHKLLKSITRDAGVPAPSIDGVESVGDEWRGIVDVIDGLLEKADACLDEYTGVIKRLTPAQEKSAGAQRSVNSHSRSKFPSSKNLPKPQLLFQNVPRNDETAPFKPLLCSKPHALVPLEQCLVPFVNEDGVEEYPNPYEAEIAQYQYPDAVHESNTPIAHQPFDTTDAIFVDTPEKVRDMLEELKKASEIAVDLEHHDQRTYIGLVSLMQISTRDKDWIVDTLKPWRQDLQILNEVFADPKILKVFHGSTCDMIWLQRDLGLYVVGLFDTYHATKVLGHIKHSLAALLDRYLHIQADKQYQLADWRIRPLTKEMFKYARSDTHYLLYIYDRLRNDLIEKSNQDLPNGDLVTKVLERSKKEALQRYERPIYDGARGQGVNGWYNALMRTPVVFSKEQFSVFRAIHEWRDVIARKEDENPHYVMSNRTLFSLATTMPTDTPSVISASYNINPPLQTRFGDLAWLIAEAKAAGKNGPEMNDLLQPTRLKRKRLSPTGSTSPSTPASGIHDTGDEAALVVQPIAIASHTSVFWGNSPLDHRVPLPKSSNIVPDVLRLSLPLPTRLIKQSESVQPEQLPSPVTPSSKTQDASVKHDNEGDVFVLKQVKEINTEQADSDSATLLTEETGVNTIPSAESEQEQSEESAVIGITETKGQKRKRRKRSRNAGKKAPPGTQRENDDGIPLDYENAPSMLHPKQGELNANALPTFNPYAKAMNAPSGSRKVKREMPGKSLTFKG